jgi:hypothetical protein
MELPKDADIKPPKGVVQPFGGFVVGAFSF